MYRQYKEGEQGRMEAVVCQVGDMQNGEMKEVKVGDSKALLVKDASGFYAIGHKCTHYSAPLVKGALGNGHVRCPWHGACFNYKTGDIEDFPGLDSVPKFEVKVVGNDVKVIIMKSDVGGFKRQKAMVCASAEDKRSFVIVGGGPASVSCAETLRQEGYKGNLTIISKEKNIAYDRPKLSKALNVKADEIALRKTDFYSTYNIVYETDSPVESVDTGSNSVKLESGNTVTYDKLLIATGANPRNCTFIKNYELDNIHTLRTVEDGKTIADKGKDKNVVIIGTSFIGGVLFTRKESIYFGDRTIRDCSTKYIRIFSGENNPKGVEVAAALVSKAASVTIIDLVEAPFQLALGKEIGNAIKKLLEEKGIKFYFQNSVSEFIDEEGVLKQVRLKDDTVLDADLCVVGIGVGPATEFLKDTGLAITDRGFITVDKNMRTSQDNIFAAGDVTHFPLFMMNNEQVNIQHWQMAHQQGRIAALNMLDKSTPIKSVPYFWTMIFGKSLRYCGYGVGYDDIVIHGNLDELKFVAYYTKGAKVIAVASLNYDPIVSQAAEMFLSELPFKKTDVESDATAWTAKIPKFNVQVIRD